MPMRREQGTCTGRGFADTDADGWCAKLKAWIVKTPANGGPGWTIILDRSAQPVSKNITAVNTTTDVITIVNHGFLHGEPIRFTTTGSQMGNISTGTKYYVWRIDADTFKVCDSWSAFMNGTTRDITSAGSGNAAIAWGPYIVVSDKANPAVQDNAKIIKIGYETTVSANVYCQMFFSKGITANSHPLGVWAGHFIKTVDAGPFTYDFRGNLEFLVLQSRIPAEARWYRWVLDEWAPLTEFCEDDATINATVAANAAFTINTSVVLTLQNAAQVNALTKGQGYFVYYAGLDTNGNEVVKVNYGVIDQKGVADGLLDTQIRLAVVSDNNGTRTIMSGSRITPYWHRFFVTAYFENVDRQLNDFTHKYSTSYYRTQQPYYSYTGNGFGVTHPQNSYIQMTSNFSAETDIINKGAQDNGLFIVQKPAIYELNGGGTVYNSNVNRIWGEVKNLYTTNNTGMTDMETGRTINSKDYVSLGDASQIYAGSTQYQHLLVLHTESAV